MVSVKKNLKDIVNRQANFFTAKKDLINFLKKEKLEKAFLNSNNKTYVAVLNNDNISYQQCPQIAVDRSSLEVIQLLKEYEMVVVLDKKDVPIGYIDYMTLSTSLVHHYNHLEAYLNTILHTIDESCTVIDAEGKVLIWTKGAEQLFSVKAKDILGKPITDFFSADRLEILNALQHGTSVTHMQHQARHDLVVLINSNPVRLDDNIIGAVVSEMDITSQIRLNNELFSTSEKLFHLEEEVRKASLEDNPFTHIRGNSSTLKKTLDIAEKAATTNASVLIYGESGVGKELFAKAIHNLREDANAPFIAINCGAIPAGLFESEIFGYERGAFSGADQKGKKGKVELAKNGTLFLDEVGEMPLEMQVKFLRLLQEKKFFPVGGTKEIEVDFRIVAATNRDLQELIKEGKFREDLYYRLNVVNFTVPPLRKRPEDIIELTHYFLYEVSRQYNKPIHGISQDVMQNLLRHQWPGNIRELKNVVERLVVFSDNGEIKLDHLPREMNVEQSIASEQAHPFMQPLMSAEDDNRSLKARLEEYEKAILIEELKKAGGNKQLCAKNLQITRATLYNRLNRLGIDM
ncbi:sigma-54 interaction domain-containing protein [Sporosarcina ureilytica]|uniref:Sigma-54-dependent Fis family transcriptional regulator n=1 Tax=Sporosarcina ureilytica TaxID=298596 RepID=A0A1D8JIN0_9BACL|nr:sigma 54-interacting transcriptional regulator [Sporosarcina ureilytica]AOV08568.1 sigma-54-dependent Fis family transcriptional regulator [Sporosarcina ureilytica]